MYQIDASHTDLAEEFRKTPFGPHSPALQRILLLLRGGPLPGRPILLVTETGSWMIGTLPERRGEPIPAEGEVYDDLGVATWELFRRRWERATGQPLEL